MHITQTTKIWYTRYLVPSRGSGSWSIRFVQSTYLLYLSFIANGRNHSPEGHTYASYVNIYVWRMPSWSSGIAFMHSWMGPLEREARVWSSTKECTYCVVLVRVTVRRTTRCNCNCRVLQCNCRFVALHRWDERCTYYCCSVGYRIESSDQSKYRTFDISYRACFALHHPAAPPWVIHAHVERMIRCIKYRNRID